MTSAIYASISALLICWLSLNVIRTRRQNKIRYGDGGNVELQIARSAHSNAVENIPIALLLLFVMDYNQANIYIIHILGIVFISGRLIHARGILTDNIRRRVLGMQLTIYTIIAMAMINLVYIPYNQLLN